MKMRKTIRQSLTESGIDYKEEIPLHTVCTLRVGGIADLGIYPKSEGELSLAVAALRSQGVPFEVIGRGSNLFFGDGRFSGALILTEGMTAIRREGNHLFADCGVTLAALATYAAEHSLSGLEFARGIPGSLGAAVFMNAGAYGSSMDTVVVSTRAMDRRTGEVFTLTDHGFGYRRSVYMEHPHWICLGAELALRQGDREEILGKMAELSKKRRDTQPLEFPSAGSYFKRPEGYFAGKLIEDAGLKGRSVGGAEIAVKHAGFLINRGGATARDVLALEKLVRDEVKEQFGVVLEREVRYLPTD